MTLLLSITSRHPHFVCRSCRGRLTHPIRGLANQALRIPQSQTWKRQRVPDYPARTRFAPSPTGNLHLGSLRTALFNYLLAKKTGGKFVLRIEDTDRKRTVPQAEERILEDLRWAGLEWDEGPVVGGPFGPYQQSKRTLLYQKHANDLVESGHAYRCFCTTQRLHDLAEQRSKLGLPTDYDRTCADIPKEESDDRARKGEANVIRLRVPEYYPQFADTVYGIVGKGAAPVARSADQAYDDPILLKSDGLPTYHLANVVDDHHMEINHVIRGTEWLTATPKHLAMYDAFGWTPPTFSHVGLLVDEQGNKLSKRNMDTEVASYRDAGFYPETLTNFVALLGWSHQNKSDVMSLEQLVENFTLKFTKGNTTVTTGKLDFLQRANAQKRLAPPEPESPIGPDDRVWLERRKVAEALESHIRSNPERYEGYKEVHDNLGHLCRTIVSMDWKNYTTSAKFVQQHDYLFNAPKPQPSGKQREAGYPEVEKSETIAGFTEALEKEMRKDWQGLKSWNAGRLRQTFDSFVEERSKLLFVSELHYAPTLKKLRQIARQARQKHGPPVQYPGQSDEDFERQLEEYEFYPQDSYKLADMAERLCRLCDAVETGVYTKKTRQEHFQPFLVDFRDRIQSIYLTNYDNRATAVMLVDSLNKKLREERKLVASDIPKNVKKSLMRYLRQVLTGGQSGPGIFEVMVLLGQKITMQRLKNYVAVSEMTKAEKAAEHARDVELGLGDKTSGDEGAGDDAFGPGDMELPGSGRLP